jgi:hypothetical protein
VAFETRVKSHWSPLKRIEMVWYAGGGWIVGFKAFEQIFSYQVIGKQFERMKRRAPTRSDSQGCVCSPNDGGYLVGYEWNRSLGVARPRLDNLLVCGGATL